MSSIPAFPGCQAPGSPDARKSARAGLGLAFLVAAALADAPASAQQTLPFNATYIGVANTSGPDSKGFLTVTSRLFNPLASFGLTEADFSQTVFVFSDPNLIVGTSVFQQFGGGPDKLFTSYSGIATPFDPPNGVLVSNLSGAFTFTGGAGRFAGATGGGTFTGTAKIVGSETDVSVNFQGPVAPVPEASTTVSLGLLLALGGVVVAAKRKKTVA